MKGPVVFDFDKTLTNKDTLFGFYQYVNRNNLFFKFKRIILLAGALFYKLRIINNDQIKKIGVNLFLSGLPNTILEVKAGEYAKKIELNSIYRQFFLTTPKDKRIIVSASFEVYLKKIFPNENVVGSNLAIKNGKVCGLQRNMYGLEKKKKMYEIGITSIDTLYTDSYSDMPLMKMAEDIILIKNNSVEKKIQRKNI